MKKMTKNENNDSFMRDKNIVWTVSERVTVCGLTASPTPALVNCSSADYTHPWPIRYETHECMRNQ